MKTCECGNEMSFKQGTSKKTGRPYSGWFCKKPEDGGCGEAQFDPSPAPSTPQGGYASAQKKPLDSVKTMLLSYAKDIVCARIASGEKIAEPIDATLTAFKILYAEYQKA